MDSSTNLAFNGLLSEPGPLDASYKLLFSYPEVVRDLVPGFIPNDWLTTLICGAYLPSGFARRQCVKANINWCCRKCTT